MRELNLPKAITIRFDLNGDVSKGAQLLDIASDRAVIIKNGSEILSAVIMIEDRMIEAVSKVLFYGTDQNLEYRDFFVSEVIGTSYFSFAFKRRVFTRLLEQFQLLESEEIKALKAGLTKIMQWRNAFAHGKVSNDLNGRFLLAYHCDGHKELVLDDDFFRKVEETIRNCLYVCNEIIHSKKEKA